MCDDQNDYSFSNISSFSKNCEYNTLNVKLQNIRSLFKKLDYVKTFLLLNNVDICFFTETWLNSKILNSMIKIQGYEVLRSDRPGRKGGGVAIYYKDSLDVQLIANNCIPSTFSNFEFSAIRLNTSFYKITFLCFYIPPDSSNCLFTVNNACKVISSYIPYTDPFVLLGDFNFPRVDWKTFTAPNCCPAKQNFLDFCLDNCLSQTISSPTHCDGNILDLVFCNLRATNELISSSVDLPMTTTCDHNLISLVLTNQEVQCKSVRKPIRNFKQGDYAKINNILGSQDWSFLNTNSSFQHRYDQFIFLLNKIIDEHIPKKTFRKKTKGLKLPRHIKKLLRLKLKTSKLVKAGKSSNQIYKNIAKEYEYEVKKWHEKIERNICENPNNKKLYSFANNKLKTKFTIPPLNDSTGNTLKNDTEKAEIFNQTFQTQFTSDDGNTITPSTKIFIPMSEIFITEEDLMKALSSTKDKLTETPEGIPPYFIKRVAKSLMIPLLYIYNYSIKHNTVPTQWKQSTVVPIYKKGDRTVPSNYRPVALTSSFCRVLEAIISSSILNHLFSNNLLLSSQFGFLPNRSSCSQLLWCLQDWYTSYCEENTQFVVYTDITKAFDSVSHTKLAVVLKSYGLDINVLYWIENFLTDRLQTVKINSSFSSPLPIISGVPQGSVLGPLLFIIFMNDIILTTESHQNVKIALFADDAKFMSNDANELQLCLNSFSDTIEQYQLRLAPQKSLVLPIGKTKTVTSNPWTFNIDSTALENKSCAKDLGVLINTDLSWKMHVNSISRQAATISYQILKSFRSKNIWTLVQLFKCYIRPRIEYNTQIWSPYLKQDIDKLENIQRRYTKFICQRCNIPFSSYEDRLKKLDLLSLQDRRIRYDLITMYKIINNLSDLNFEDYFYKESISYSLRKNTTRIKTKNNYASNVWSGSFFARASDYWNKLDVKISSAMSLKTFKFQLNSVSFESLKRKLV